MRRPHPQPYPSAAQLDAANTERCELGITLEEIATEASKTARLGTCTVPTVSRVFSGRTRSQNVLDAFARVKARKGKAA